ncbi:MAG: ABC transporter permease [Bacteroidota bacterium]
MLSNYLKLALRQMRNQKLYTLINVLGLAIGMAACIIILLFVQKELSYDEFHDHSDRIYRVSRQWFNEDGETSLHLGHCAPPFAPLLKNDFPGPVEEAIRLLRGFNSLLIVGDKQIEEPNFFFAEDGFFQVFSYDLLGGDPQKVLAEPNALVLTETAAKRYFGSEDPIGKTLSYQNQVDLKVTGLMKDVPDNSHIHFDMLCSFQTVEDFFGRENLMNNWGSNNYATYLLLKEDYEYKDLEEQLPGFLNSHLEAYGEISPSMYNKLNLWPLTSIHLYSHLDSEIQSNGDIAYVYIFSAIALLILVIACINFVNLSTARATRRAKEVGLRKVIGANRGILFRQFMTESFFLAFLAMALSILLVEFFLPYLNTHIFEDTSLAMHYGRNGFILLLLGGLTLVVGILAGSYPALYLSRFQPIETLKNSAQPGSHKSWLRSGLVVFQFAISIMLIIGVGVIQQQLNYVRTKPLGFDKENVLSLPISDEIYQQFDRLKGRLLQEPGITDVTLSSRVPSDRLLDSQGGSAEVDGEMKPLNTRVADIHVGHDYLNTYGVKFVAGRNFDKNLASDSAQAFILNEAAVKAIGWDSPEAAIDKRLTYGGRNGRVIGITEDFHFENLRQSIAPIVFMITQGRANEISIRLHAGAKEEVLSFLENEWTYLRPGYPFTYNFIADSFNEQYGEDERLAKLVRYFSILAIIIAALGLLGLASFMTEQRFREIGIRKVLGATATQILLLLTSRFTYLVLFAIPIGALLAYLLVDYWLDSFAYSTNIRMGPFIIAGAGALLLAWITVIVQTYRAAFTDPVKAIKEE